MELEAHPNKLKLMQIAFTYRRGKSDGEYLLQTNRPFQQKLKKMAKKIEEARK